MAGMTIDEARSLSKADLEIGAKHVATAQGAADDAAKLLQAVEAEQVESDGELQHDAIAAARNSAEFTARRLGRIREAAERARQAQRLLALDKMHAEITAYADQARGDNAMAAALKQVEDGLAALRTAADKHNATVADLRSRAAAAGAREINGGPGPQDAHVALGDLWGDGNGVRAGNVHVGPVDETAIAEAIRRTVHGDVLTYGEQPRAAYGVAALERHVVQAYG